MTRSIITYSRGDVVLVPFPFTDMTFVKKRPGVIISTWQYNFEHDDVIVMAISSKKNYQQPTDEMVVIDGSRLSQCGLLNDSVIRVDKLFTIQKLLIIKKLGTVPPILLEQVTTKLNNIIGNKK